ncbi:MAG: hypothetical protein ACPGR7_05840 [Flavobacteriaceae bacterium]
MRILFTLLFFLPLLSLNAQTVKLSDLNREIVYVGDESPEAFINYQAIKSKKEPFLNNQEVSYKAFPVKGIAQEAFVQDPEISVWEKVDLLFDLNEKFLLEGEQDITFIPEELLGDIIKEKKREVYVTYVGPNPKEPEYLLISINPKSKQKAYVFNMGEYNLSNRPLGNEKTFVMSSCIGRQNYLVKVSKEDKWIVQHQDEFSIRSEVSGLSSLK